MVEFNFRNAYDVHRFNRLLLEQLIQRRAEQRAATLLRAKQRKAKRSTS